MTSSNPWTDGTTLVGPLQDVFRAWLDLRGLTYLQVPMAEET
jgi:hypothetical protein